MRWTPSLVVVYSNIVLYAVCFMLQRPIEPFLVEKLGARGDAGTMSYGALQSFFGAMQTAGSLVMGVLLDKIGAKWAFVVCFASSALSYCLLSFSTSLPLLYLSKVPTFFQSGYLISQALIAQETSEEDRATALGRATSAYTLGATVGPLVGGWLGASGDYYFSAKLAVAGSLLSVALSFLLPATPAGGFDSSSKVESCDKPKSHAGFAKMFEVAARPVVVAVLATKLSASVGVSIGYAVFPLVLKNGFGVAEGGMGIAMSTSMIVNSLVGAVVVGPCTRAFTPRTLLPACILAKACFEGASALFAPGSAAVSLLPAGVHASMPFAASYILANVFQFLLATTLTVISTSAVDKDEQGSLLGVEHAMFSGARIGTPTLATYLFSVGGLPLISGTCTAISLCLLLAVQTLVLPRCDLAKKSL